MVNRCIVKVVVVSAVVLFWLILSVIINFNVAYEIGRLKQVTLFQISHIPYQQ